MNEKSVDASREFWQFLSPELMRGDVAHLDRPANACLRAGGRIRVARSQAVALAQTWARARRSDFRRSRSLYALSSGTSETMGLGSSYRSVNAGSMAASPWPRTPLQGSQWPRASAWGADSLSKASCPPPSESTTCIWRLGPWFADSDSSQRAMPRVQIPIAGGERNLRALRMFMLGRMFHRPPLRTPGCCLPVGRPAEQSP